MTCVAIDFETTGTVSGWPNEPWQVGIVTVRDGVPVPESAWGSLLRVSADRPFSPRAPGRWAELREALAEAPDLMDIWPDLQSRLVGIPLVAHNAATERTVLTRQAPLTPFGPWIDTLALVRRIWPLMKSYALGDLAAVFGLVGQVDALCPGRKWHDALYDACAGAVLLCHIMKTVGTSRPEELLAFTGKA